MVLRPHPDVERLELYLLGRVSRSQADELEEHLLLCDHCRTLCILFDGQIRDIRAGLKAANEGFRQSCPS